MDDDEYGCAAAAVGVPAFFLAWGYAISEFGWFLGLSLGWVPAYFLAVIAALLWPLIVLAALGLLALILAG